jgi:hypothetical protein
MASNNPGTGSDSLSGNEKATRFDVHELLSGMVTVGGNGSEAVSETESPTSFSFYAGSGRDLQYDIEVLVENTATTAQTATISGTLSAARMYNRDDEYTGNVADSGETLASDSVTVDIDAGVSGAITLFDETQSLDNRNLSVDLSSDNSSVVINRANTNTLGGTYRTTVDEGGGKVVQDHFGRTVEEVDPLEGSANYPHGLEKDGDEVVDHPEFNTYKQYVEANFVHSTEDDIVEGLLTYTKGGNPVTTDQSAAEIARWAGSTSDLVLDIQGGHGRVGLAWNAFYDNSANTWKYIVDSEPAMMIHLSGGQISLRTASSGTVGGSISWEEATIDNGSIDQADNANTLDNLNSSQFLRSDASDSYTGSVLTFDASSILGINDGSSIEFSNGSAKDWFIQTANGNISISQPNTGGREMVLLDSAGDHTTTELLVGCDRVLKESIDEGEGSGLNADFLDGIDGSGYLRSNATDTFTGGALFVGSTSALGIEDGATIDYNNGSSENWRTETSGGDFVIGQLNSGGDELVLADSGGDFSTTSLSIGGDELLTEVSTGAGIRKDGNGDLVTSPGVGLANSSSNVYLDAAPTDEGGLAFNGSDQVGVAAAGGLNIGTNGVFVDAGDGIALSNGLVTARTGRGMGTLNGDLVTTYDTSQGIDVNGSGQLVTTTGDGIQHDGGDIATTQKQRHDKLSIAASSTSPVSSHSYTSLPAPFDTRSPQNAVITASDSNAVSSDTYIINIGADTLDIGFDPDLEADSTFRVSLLG